MLEIGATILTAAIEIGKTIILNLIENKMSEVRVTALEKSISKAVKKEAKAQNLKVSELQVVTEKVINNYIQECNYTHYVGKGRNECLKIDYDFENPEEVKKILAEMEEQFNNIYPSNYSLKMKKNNGMFIPVEDDNKIDSYNIENDTDESVSKMLDALESRMRELEGYKR